MFKRVAINILLGIAALFTKEKILQRVLIATLDDVRKNVDDVSTVRVSVRVSVSMSLCVTR